MPAARRRAWASGGTSVTLAGARRPFWLLLVLGAAGAGAIYFHFVLGEETSSSARRRARAAAAAVAHDGGVDDAEDAQPPATPSERETALDELRSALDDAELVARAELSSDEPETVLLRSPTCDATELGAVIEQHQATLAGAGFTGVKCFAPNGTVLYKATW